MIKDPTSRTLLLLAGFALLVWMVRAIREVLVPFAIAFALAAILDPLIDRLQARGLARWVAIALVFAVFLGFFFLGLVILVPLALTQAASLSGNLLPYLSRALDTLNAWAQAKASLLRELGLPISATDALARYRGELLGAAQGLMHGLVGLFGATAARLMWVLLVPAVLLYALADLDLFRARLLHLVPGEQRKATRALSHRVGQVFPSDLRGLLMVCSGVGLATWLLLALVFRLEYAFIIAILAAILYAVPYVGEWIVLAMIAVIAWATAARRATWWAPSWANWRCFRCSTS